MRLYFKSYLLYIKLCEISFKKESAVVMKLAKRAVRKSLGPLENPLYGCPSKAYSLIQSVVIRLLLTLEYTDASSDENQTSPMKFITACVTKKSKLSANVRNGHDEKRFIPH